MAVSKMSDGVASEPSEVGSPAFLSKEVGTLRSPEAPL